MSMRAPCDEAAMQSGGATTGCAPEARTWVLAVTILGSSMAFIDGTVINVAIPAIQASFHTSLSGVQWVVESYGVLLAALILFGGSLGDLLGRRKVFLSGVAVFAAGSIFCGLAGNILMLILARSVQGIGAALLVPGSLAIITACFDEGSRGQAIGTWSGFTAITTAVGPVLGGWLVEHASWRWAFFINVPVAAAVMAISWRHVPESRSAEAQRIDWWGTLLATGGLGSLVTGFVESGVLGWKHPLVYGSLAAGLACLAAFVPVERRTASPMVPPTLFSSPSFSGANLLTLLLYAAVGIFFFLFPMNLIQVQNYSPTEAGAAGLPLILLMFTLSRWSGGLVARYGPRLPLALGPLIAALGFTLFALPASGGSYWKSFFPAMVVLGLGMAATVAPLTTVIMQSAGEDRAGTASGINNAVARVASVLAIAVFGIVMARAFSSRLDQRIGELALPAGAVHAIQANQTRLAALPIPAGLDPSARDAVKRAVAGAFIHGFRTVMLLCAALAAAGAVMGYASLRGEE